MANTKSLAEELSHHENGELFATDQEWKLRRADATRMRILVAAAQIFSKQGYSDSSLRDIAKTIDMKAGSIYYHFSSKEQILDEVLSISVKLMTEAVERELAALPRNATHADRLRAAIRTHLVTLLVPNDEQSAFMHVYDSLSPVLKRRNRVARRRYALIWKDIFDKGIAAGEFTPEIDPALIVPFLLGAIGRTLEWFDPRRNVEKLAANVAAAHLSGICVKKLKKTRRKPA